MQNLQDFQSAALRKVTTATTADIRVLTFNDTSIRCIEINGEPMFAPIDIYRCLGFAAPAAAARHFLRNAESVRAELWPYPGKKPRVISASGVLALLDSVRGERNSRAAAFRDWFQSSAVHRVHDCPAAPAPAAPVRMADISEKLDPRVQAALHEAFRAIQEVSARLSAALERRADLMAALGAERRDRPRP